MDAFSKQVDESGEALAEIVGSVREVSEVVDKIARANFDQSVGVQQVNQAISEMNDMTESTNRVEVKVSANSNKLREQADYLKSDEIFQNIQIATETTWHTRCALY